MMSRPSTWLKSGVRRLLCLAATTVAVTGCDQATKMRAVDTLSDVPGQSVTVFDPWVAMSLAYNEGTAFSVIRDAGDHGWILAAFSVLVVALLGAWLWREGGWTRCIGAGLVSGGALGNGLDRVLRAGVVDFISVTLPGGYRWPTFNVADVVLVVGAALMLIASARTTGQDPPEKSQPEPAPG